VKISGIYRITTPDGYLYIGHSKHILTRWKQHIESLEHKNHCCQRLQSTYDKYGIDGFKFEILETIRDPQLMSIREQEYMNAGAELLLNTYVAVKTETVRHYDRFINFINGKWLVPPDIDADGVNKYRIWRQCDKDEIIDMAIKCRVCEGFPYQVTFARVMRLLEEHLGYEVVTGKLIAEKERKTYKLIVSFDEDSKTYQPVIPTIEE